MVAWLVILETGGVSERPEGRPRAPCLMTHTALEERGTASDGVCRTLRYRWGADSTALLLREACRGLSDFDPCLYRAG